jgi:hypothetical protein
MHRRATFRPFAWALLTTFAACGDAPLTAPSGPKVDVLAVIPEQVALPVGGSRYMNVIFRDPTGASLPLSLLQWTSTVPSVATVGLDRQLVGRARGTALIIARAEGRADTSHVAVTGGPVASVTISPTTIPLTVGSSATATATPRDASGASLPGIPVDWATVDPAVALVTAPGTVQGVSVGSTQLRATAGGITGTAVVTVLGAGVARVDISPAAAAILIGTTRQLTATPRNAAGAPIGGKTVVWSTSTPTILSVSTDGLVQGLADGIGRVSAQVDGVTGHAVINVSSPGGSGQWPHEPDGFVAISDQPWDLLSALGWVVQFGTATLGVDLGAPLSPPGVLAITYPAGFGGGEAPGTLTRTIIPSRNLFVGLWWKPSDPWQGHESNVNKIQFVFAESGGDITMVMYGGTGGPFQLRVIPQFPGLPSNWLEPNVANIAVALGEWHRIEWLLEYGETIGSGRVRWWLDGELIGDHSGVPFPDAGLLDYKISPTWGGVGDVKDQTDFFWFDHVYLSRR